MPFSSLEFASVLPAGIALYWLLRFPAAQRIFVIVASGLFLSFTGLSHLWVFAGVVLGTTLLLAIANRAGRLRRSLLAAGVAALVATLAYYKTSAGHPLGVSYYTFILIGFLLEAINGATLPAWRIVPSVAFFPLLLSGPIVRWRNWAPQFTRRRKPASARNVTIGAQLFAVGAFKKILIADAIAVTTAPVWMHPDQYSRLAVAAAIAAFYLQVYADFSGYTDMARGVARMMGFHLPINFKAPYLSATPLQFWSRWHISLTTWIRDFVFTPLSIAAWRRFRSRRLTTAITALLVVTLMTLVGLWHGVSWAFVGFGAAHGVLIAVWYLAVGTGRKLTTPQRVVSAVLFQVVLMASLVLFRSGSLDGAAGVFNAMMSGEGASSLNDAWIGLALAAVAVFAFQVIEARSGVTAMGRRLAAIRTNPRLLAVFVISAIAVFYFKGLTLEGVWISPAEPFFNQGQEKFIYFQF